VNLAGLPLTRLVGGLRPEELLTMFKKERAKFASVMLTGVNLQAAQLAGATLSGAELEGADLRGAQLAGAFLNDALFGDNDSISPYLADIQWDTANLAVVDWSQVVELGDEHEARQERDSDGNRKEKNQRLWEHKSAVRANRQLSVALQGQGLDENAARFAYRALVLPGILFSSETGKHERAAR
jgi:hypothetical protein